MSIGEGSGENTNGLNKLSTITQMINTREIKKKILILLNTDSVYAFFSQTRIKIPDVKK